MYNRAVIITDQDVQPEEFSYPLYRLIEAGIEVELCLTGKVDATDKNGTELRTLYKKSYPDRDFISPSQLKHVYDIVILPGGFAPERVRLNNDVLRFLKEHNEKGRIIGAICHGPQILISAGLCKDKVIAAFEGIHHDITNAGGIYVKGSVVEGNLVTADHYRENPRWMKLLLETYEAYVLANYVG